MAHLIAHYRSTVPQLLSQEDWEYISQCLPGRSPDDCFFKFLSMEKKLVKDHRWQQQQDKILIGLVDDPNEADWTQVSKELFKRNGNSMKVYRSGKQCRQHYFCHIDPHLKKQPWSEEEDRQLLQLHSQLGRRWYLISKILVGRNENAIKNRFSIICKDQKVTKPVKKQISIENCLVEQNTSNQISNSEGSSQLFMVSGSNLMRVQPSNSPIVFSSNYKIERPSENDLIIGCFSSLSLSIDSKYPFPSSIDDVSQQMQRSMGQLKNFHSGQLQLYRSQLMGKLLTGSVGQIQNFQVMFNRDEVNRLLHDQ